MNEAHTIAQDRFKVARLLDLARAEGVVTIEVDDPRGVDADLSEALRAALGRPRRRRDRPSLRIR